MFYTPRTRVGCDNISLGQMYMNVRMCTYVRVCVYVGGGGKAGDEFERLLFQAMVK